MLVGRKGTTDMTARFVFDADSALARASFFQAANPATSATIATNRQNVAEVAVVADLGPSKNESFDHSVANVAGGPEVDLAEREAVAVVMGNLAKVYAKAFAAIQAHPPANVPRERWNQFINDAGLFLDRWGQEAERLGWRPDELFGLHPTAPMARYDCMGVLWMLRGEQVTELTDRLARLTDGLAYYRK
jgi:hypothetical protein